MLDNSVKTRSKDVLYLTVLPSYRQSCINQLRKQRGDALLIYSGPSQLDSSVRTGISPDHYQAVKNVSILGGRLLLQVGSWSEAVSARTAILDLNPRNLSAWLLLILRRARRRRTLVWGHLHPRAGGKSKTAALRRAMRRLSDGTVLYGYDSVVAARSEVPDQPVWVAPNSIYDRADMIPATVPDLRDRPPRVVYVGRLVGAKKVSLAIRAVAEPNVFSREVNLDIVGAGAEQEALRALAIDLGVADRVHFRGWIEDPAALREIYSDAVCALSPGYAGLSLTQSLGFGVPVIVADDEPHAPEIELSALGGVRFFDANSSSSLASAIDAEVRSAEHQDRRRLSSSVVKAYSAEAMAQGLARALDGLPQGLAENGWPRES